MKEKESKALTEILDIRAKLSKKMKNMTAGERLAYIKRGAAELEKEFNLKLPKKTAVKK